MAGSRYEQESVWELFEVTRRFTRVHLGFFNLHFQFCICFIVAMCLTPICLATQIRLSTK